MKKIKLSISVEKSGIWLCEGGGEWCKFNSLDLLLKEVKERVGLPPSTWTVVEDEVPIPVKYEKEIDAIIKFARLVKAHPLRSYKIVESVVG